MYILCHTIKKNTATDANVQRMSIEMNSHTIFGNAFKKIKRKRILQIEGRSRKVYVMSFVYQR